VLISSTGYSELSIALFGELADQTPVSFTSYFFKSINLGRSIEESFAEAAHEIQLLQGSIILQSPTIYIGNETLAAQTIGTSVDDPSIPIVDRIPPEVTDVIFSSDILTVESPLLIEAEVSDNRDIQSVSLQVGDAGTGTETVFSMTQNTSNTLYQVTLLRADLPSLSEGQQSVSLSVIASDSNGNISAPVLTTLQVEEDPTWVGEWWKM